MSNLNATTNHRTKEDGNQLVVSYMTLRNFIGFAGMLLPVALLIFTKEEGGLRQQPSISDYYYTNTGDVLVCVLCIMATFLVTYNGYGPIEKLWAFAAAAGAMGVAFNPTNIKYTHVKPLHNVHTIQDPLLVGNTQLHLISAMVFFIALIVFSMYYFNKPPQNPATTVKTTRRTQLGRKYTHYICGSVMIGCIAVIGIYFMKHGDHADPHNPTIFWCETVALWAFGISWLTKGETLWPRETHYVIRAFRMMKR